MHTEYAMSKKRKSKAWEPPPLNPKDFFDPYRRRQATRSSRHTVTKGLKTLLKYCVRTDGE